MARARQSWSGAARARSMALLARLRVKRSSRGLLPQSVRTIVTVPRWSASDPGRGALGTSKVRTGRWSIRPAVRPCLRSRSLLMGPVGGACLAGAPELVGDRDCHVVAHCGFLRRALATRIARGGGTGQGRYLWADGCGLEWGGGLLAFRGFRARLRLPDLRPDCGPPEGSPVKDASGRPDACSAPWGLVLRATAWPSGTARGEGRTALIGTALRRRRDDCKGWVAGLVGKQIIRTLNVLGRKVPTGLRNGWAVVRAQPV
jgi:hypothetical protein